MASDLNTTACIGRLTRPCDLRFTNAGFAICSFSIAVKNHKKVNGDWEDVASFFECSMFGKHAEGVSKYLQKGQQVGVSGHLEQQTWNDKTTGQKRSKIVIIVDSLSLIGGSSSNASKPVQNNGSDDNESDVVPF